MSRTEKVGIACGCRKLNYGSLLQSYALCSAIKKLDYDCEFVWMKGNLFKHYNIRPGKIAGVFMNAIKHPSIAPKVFKSVRRVSSKKSSYAISEKCRFLFERFVEKYLPVRMYSWHDLKKAERKYRKFVCGSDQIWNSYEYYLDPMYFLRFTKQSKRIAYAPSFGVNSVSYYNRNRLKKYLSEMGCISVREESGRDICRELLHKEVPIVLDPTFLLSAEEWKAALGLRSREEKYCLAYFLNSPSERARELIWQIRETIAIKAVPIAYDCFLENEYTDAGPEEFLELLMNAQYVITDSFHGTILSINFKKQFLCFERQYASQSNGQSSRITDILGRLGLLGRYNVEKANMLDTLLSEIDYESVGHQLEMLKEKSEGFLKEALASE